MVISKSSGSSSTSRISISSCSFVVTILPSLVTIGRWPCVVLRRQAEKKGSTLIDLRFGPDAPAVLMNDSLNGGQSHACSFEILATVQPLKDAKQFVSIFHIEAHAVVAYEVHKLAFH